MTVPAVGRSVIARRGFAWRWAWSGLLVAASACHGAGAKVVAPGTGGSDQGSGGAGGAAAQVIDAATDVVAIAPVCHAPHGTSPALPVGLTDPGAEGDGDFTIGPTYADAPELLGMAGVPRGTLKSFMLSSTTSPTYPGVTGPYSRNVTVYIPSQYVPGTPAPFMVVQDGSSFVATIPAVLNNLINDHRVPVMIAILINPGPGDGPGSERSFEYDTVSDAYVNFIESEVLPKVEETYGVTLTTDPEGRAAMGWSSGAAAAFTMGWQCPSLYRRILTYSGTFVNVQPDQQSPHGAWEYHEHLIPAADPKPLRVFLEVGDHDNGYTDPEQTYRNWLLANQRMAAALKAKGYHYRFVTGVGAGHIDPKVVGQTLPETLVWLWRGYPTN